MSRNIFEDFNSGKESKTEIELANALNRLVDLFEGVYQINKRQLFPFSILETDKYFSEILKNVKVNSKQLGRKYEKSVMKIFNYISDAIASKMNEKSGLVNFFDRK